MEGRREDGKGEGGRKECGEGRREREGGMEWRRKSGERREGDRDKERVRGVFMYIRIVN